MHPVLVDLGGFPIRSFGVLMLIAFVVATWMAAGRAARYGLDRAQVVDLAFWVLIAGVLGARLLYIAQDLPYFLARPSKLLSLQFDGLTSFGGILGGALAAWGWARRRGVSMIAVLDVMGAPFLVAHAIGRIGCFLNGCCYGHLSTGPLAVPMHGASGLHEPAQLYDTLMTAVLAVLLVARERGGLASGQSGMLAIAFYGLSRFIYEFMRAGTVEEVSRGVASSTYWGNLPITEAQAVALVMMAGGVAAAWRLRPRPA
jgi:phosphatidylglycerol:prolipoprotein diacylglycerol transferase